MNLKEGTRRLALLLGVAGAILGGFASYLFLQPALEQKARHNRFEQLANSDVVKQERKCRLLGYPGGCSLIKLPPSATLVKPKEGKYTDADVAGFGPPETAAPPGKQYLDDAGNPEPSSPDIPKKFSAAEIIPLASELDTGDIKTINWSKGWSYTIESVETEDGLTLYPTPAPSQWMYLLVALLPILGFFVPWGAIRAIGWVGAGFIKSSK